MGNRPDPLLPLNLYSFDGIYLWGRNMESLICSICDSSFDIEGEGGINGFFGVCEVAFCVWCYASLTDMVESNCFQCQEKLHDEK
mgnify:FL=1